MKSSIYAFIIFSLLSTSCATISNNKWARTTVYTRAPAIIVVNGDSVTTRRNQVELKLERQKKPIEITTIINSQSKKLKIDYINSAAYNANIFTNLGLGMLVDRNNIQRYGYPKRIYINPNDTSRIYENRGVYHKKGDILLHLSLPHINHFNLAPEGEIRKINTGFFGITLGVDYFYHQKRFINFSATAATDFLVPFPAPVSYNGEYELMTTNSLSLSNNHQLNRFSLGYGISYARNSWHLRYADKSNPSPPVRYPKSTSANAMGLVFSSYFNVGHYFNIGAIYRPTFVRFNSKSPFEYEHLMSIDFAWKLRLTKQTSQANY